MKVRSAFRDLILLPFTSVVSLPNSPVLSIALLSRADENKRRVEIMSIPAHLDAVLCFVSIKYFLTRTKVEFICFNDVAQLLPNGYICSL